MERDTSKHIDTAESTPISYPEPSTRTQFSVSCVRTLWCAQWLPGPHKKQHGGVLGLNLWNRKRQVSALYMVCYMRHACALIQQLLYNNIEGLLKVIAMENCRTWVVNKVSISNPNPVIYIYSELRRVNCSFYFKIGACRHGDRCSRLHNKPTFSQVSWEYSFSRSSELGRLTVLPITGVIFCTL